MSELADFLLARIAEDEAVALAASPGPWHLNAESTEVIAVDDIEVAQAFALSSNQLRATAAHIARWDPARVLADCAADRRIVELHAITVTEDWVNPVDGPAYRDDDHTCAICGWVRDACDTVKLLALPYADHPDYREAWKP